MDKLEKIIELEKSQRILKKRIKRLEEEIEALINDEKLSKHKKTEAELLQDHIQAWQEYAEELEIEIEELKE